ncbi:ABC transporter permease [Mesorhizobium sp. GR13]|uniref:ABC transporter permease n=1 Tax=Mesorhizobium sp. GR13 TaxID=2562308 RepID=UPI00197FFA18|nr:ABC transporter permease [Mesorhizobium sp. GR13]
MTKEESIGAGVLSGQIAWIAVILILMMGTFALLAGGAFASVANVRNIATDACILMVMALGQLLVIITGGIDLSVGAVLVFSGVMGCLVMNTVDGPLGIVCGIAVSILSGCAWGAINGLLVTKARISPLIATLGTFGMAMGLALVISNGIDLMAPLSLVRSLGVGRAFGVVPWLVLVAAFAAIVVAILLNQTRFGRHTFAIGASATAAERAGVPVIKHLVRVYMIAGGLAGAASVMSLARFGTTTISGHLEDNLKVITAVVLGGASLLGGIGTVTGTVIGTLIPVVLLNGFVITGIQAFWQQFAIGLVLVVAVYLDSRKRATAG